MARVGLIARANNRGLGYQTLEAYRHYPFAKTMVVLTNDQWPEHPGRYPDATLATFVDGTISPLAIKHFLHDIDVVFSVETLYDWRIAEVARAVGARTVVQGNPEFYRHNRWHADQPHPDQWTWPTPWMVGHADLPAGPIVPVPIPDDADVRTAGDPHDGLFTVLHVAGHRANGDRNGTELFMQALRMIRQRVHVRLVGQDGSFPEPGKLPMNVTIERLPLGVDNRWSMYHDAHLVVLPRRYGGLCLPALEAMASGCAVAMTDCPPNDIWPIIKMPAAPGRGLRTPFGTIRTHQTRPAVIAKTIDRLAAHRDHLDAAQYQSWEWARRNTWERLRPVYDRLFAGEL